eukprot:CAMPEP_0180088532 /NCGR_PEP_ID=MMETSP0985-20121206/22310_1 /TAXON_ID=483367 /ORGANISM="non described non described, Strain CCMP 2436" /LENGTH=108 /DNA_ID=CAMNT_0022022997 /DNA_START=265 /DNA_END=588 /DNA_ORIENTATION=+
MAAILAGCSASPMTTAEWQEGARSEDGAQLGQLDRGARRCVEQQRQQLVHVRHAEGGALAEGHGCQLGALRGWRLLVEEDLEALRLEGGQVRTHGLQLGGRQLERQRA